MTLSTIGYFLNETIGPTVISYLVIIAESFFVETPENCWIDLFYLIIDNVLENIKKERTAIRLGIFFYFDKTATCLAEAGSLNLILRKCHIYVFLWYGPLFLRTTYFHFVIGKS